MTPRQVSQALLETLKIPAESISIIEWHEGDGPPSVRVWVDDRYLSYARQTAPRNLGGVEITVERRPTITAG